MAMVLLLRFRWLSLALPRPIPRFFKSQTSSLFPDIVNEETWILETDPLLMRALDVTTVSQKFQVVIPKRVRKLFAHRPGQTLQVIALPGRITLVPTQSPADRRGFLQGNGHLPA